MSLMLEGNTGIGAERLLHLVYDGAPIIQGITEFNSAVRLGSASQDDRNLASFFTLEDGRGGLGQQYADIREDLDKLFHTYGMMHTRFQELVKVPRLWVTPIGPKTPSASYKGFHLFEADVGGTTRLWATTEQELWYSDGGVDIVPMTKTTNNPLPGDALLSKIVYTPISGAMAGTQLLIMGAAARYGYAATPTTGGWLTQAQAAYDMFEFDGKLWLMSPRALKWTIDLSTHNIASGNWPTLWSFIGVYPYGQNNYMPYVLTDQHPMLPGSTSVAKIAILDVDNNVLVPLSLGLTSIVRAKALGEQIGIIHNAGRSISLYNPATRQLQDMDWNARTRHGLADGGYTALDIELGPRGQVMVLAEFPTVDFDNPSLDRGLGVWQFINTGWQRMTGTMSGFNDAVTTVVPITGMSFKYVAHNQMVVTSGSPDLGDATATKQQLDYSYIPRDESWTPNGNFRREVMIEDGMFWTPWYDAGFASIEGALLAAHLGGWASTDCPIQLWYQLDDDYTTFHFIGEFPATPLVDPEITGRPESVQQSMHLPIREDNSDAPSLHGAQFTKVRFFGRVKSTATVPGTPNAPFKSANVYPLTVQFVKRPALRDSYRFNINVEKSLIANSQGGAYSVADLMDDLRYFYDAEKMIRVRWGENRTTYAFLTSFPRVIEVEDTGFPVSDLAFDVDDGASAPALNVMKTGSMVITFAEPQ